MISRLSIRGFRRFRELKVDGLGRVNLFVGANNAGKTTLLEAVELVALGIPAALWRSSQRRGEEILGAADEQTPIVPRPQIDLSHLFSGHALGQLRIEGDGDIRRFVECETFEILPTDDSSYLDADQTFDSSRRFGESEVRSDTALSFRSHVLSQDVIMRVSPQGGLAFTERRRHTPTVGETIPTVNFLRPEGDMLRLGPLWDRVVLTPEEEQVVEALRIIEPDVEKIAFVGDERRGAGRGIYLKLRHSPRRLPLGSVGDGLKRLLALAIHLIVARDGWLLVDEIDTGLHFRVMADMWQMVIAMAARLNVQILATTHSLDCVRALGWVHREAIDEDQVTLHRLESDMQHTIRYTKQEVELAASQHVEMR